MVQGVSYSGLSKLRTKYGTAGGKAPRGAFSHTLLLMEIWENGGLKYMICCPRPLSRWSILVIIYALVNYLPPIVPYCTQVLVPYCAALNNS